MGEETGFAIVVYGDLFFRGQGHETGGERRHFRAAKAIVRHQPDLSRQLRVGDGVARPPPAQTGPRLDSRGLEPIFKGLRPACRDCRGEHRRCGEQTAHCPAVQNVASKLIGCVQ